jgi:predicted phage terminase large subunit-like protein
MALSPANMYADLLRYDLCAFIHRSFLELEQSTFHWNWHLEVLAAKLEDVRLGRCKRLIVNVPPRHLKSHAISIAFAAWLLGHDPTKKILSVTYAQDLSDNLARRSRTLMTSEFYEALFDTRLSTARGAVSDFETTSGGNRLSTSIGGVLTGRGADIIIIDDPLKADDALSEPRRRSVNDWYDNTLRSRLNSQEDGAIIIVMQRLHADDLVAHVQQSETWDVLSFPALAERDETYDMVTPYGRKQFQRKEAEILQPTLLSATTLEVHRRAMNEYNFVAQYQQNPQPPAGIIVKREWLRFYDPSELPEKFDQIVQSWDTANKDSELANFSVCTTWGLKHGLDRRMYLIDVSRRKLNFPELKRSVRELADLHHADVVLVEDKASGTSLIQELRAFGFSIVQSAPALEGDKIMRLHGQTAKIEGGFVLFPKKAPWLDTYLNELVTFPNAKNDDQVDSTVFALAWSTQTGGGENWIQYLKNQLEKEAYGNQSGKERMFPVWVPPPATQHHLITGRQVNVPENRIIEVTEEEFNPLRAHGAKRVD